MVDVRLTADLMDLFNEGQQLQDVSALVSSNLEYILALEYGHSQQAPDGMVRRRYAAHRGMLVEELEEAFREHGLDILKAGQAGVSFAALRIMRDIADKTPVDTGRAKGAWIATLPDGKRVQDGPVISKAHQRSIKRKRRK